MDHRAHCKAWETNRGCRDLVWAAALAKHLPANYWWPRPEAPYPPSAFLPPDDETSALPRGLERHPRLPGVLRSTNRPHHSIPTALLAAYATFYGADASSQPEKFVHDVSVHLRKAMQPDPQYSECRHLPPALELCLCHRLGLRRLGPSWFALHGRAVYGGRAPAPLAPPTGPSPWLFGGSSAAELGPLMVVTSGPPGPALRSRVGAALRAGHHVLLAAEHKGKGGTPAWVQLLKRQYSRIALVTALFSAPPKTMPLGLHAGFANDERMGLTSATHSWTIRYDSLEPPACYDTDRLMRHPGLLAQGSVYFVLLAPRSHNLPRWTSEATADLVRALRAITYSPSGVTGPTAAMALTIPPALLPWEERGPRPVNLTAAMHLGTAELLAPLEALIPDMDAHYPWDPDSPQQRLHAASMATATVLMSDVAAIEAVGLRRTWAWRLAAKIAKDIARHDSRAEAHEGVRREAIYRELGVVEQENTEGTTRRRLQCHLCGTPYGLLYRLHCHDGPAATAIVQRVATSCAEEAAHAPERTPWAQDNAATRVKWRNDREYIEERLAPAYARRLDSQGGVRLCYGCYAGTTGAGTLNPDPSASVTSPLCDSVRRRWPSFLRPPSPTAATAPLVRSHTAPAAVPPRREAADAPDEGMQRSRSVRACGPPVRLLAPLPPLAPCLPDHAAGSYSRAEVTRAIVLDRHLAAMAPCTRTHRPVPASHFPANQPDLGSPGHRVGDKRIADDGKEYLVAIIGPAAEITADV